MKHKILVTLRCPDCKGRFFLERRWWAARLLRGSPPMSCQKCRPDQYPH